MRTYEEQICQAVDVIAQEKINSANFDRTIEARILSCEDSQAGKYRIKYQNSTFIAYSGDSTVTYDVGTFVYVLIPGNDPEKDKLILWAGADYSGKNDQNNYSSGYGSGVGRFTNPEKNSELFNDYKNSKVDIKAQYCHIEGENNIVNQSGLNISHTHIGGYKNVITSTNKNACFASLIHSSECTCNGINYSLIMGMKHTLENCNGIEVFGLNNQIVNIADSFILGNDIQINAPVQASSSENRNSFNIVLGQTHRVFQKYNSYNPYEPKPVPKPFDMNFIGGARNQIQTKTTGSIIYGCLHELQDKDKEINYSAILGIRHYVRSSEGDLIIGYGNICDTDIIKKGGGDYIGANFIGGIYNSAESIERSLICGCANKIAPEGKPATRCMDSIITGFGNKILGGRNNIIGGFGNVISYGDSDGHQPSRWGKSESNIIGGNYNNISPSRSLVVGDFQRGVTAVDDLFYGDIITSEEYESYVDYFIPYGVWVDGQYITKYKFRGRIGNELVIQSYQYIKEPFVKTFTNGDIISPNEYEYIQENYPDKVDYFYKIKINSYSSKYEFRYQEGDINSLEFQNYEYIDSFTKTFKNGDIIEKDEYDHIKTKYLNKSRDPEKISQFSLAGPQYKQYKYVGLAGSSLYDGYSFQHPGQTEISDSFSPCSLEHKISDSVIAGFGNKFLDYAHVQGCGIFGQGNLMYGLRQSYSSNGDISNSLIAGYENHISFIQNSLIIGNCNQIKDKIEKGSNRSLLSNSIIFGYKNLITGNNQGCPILLGGQCNDFDSSKIYLMILGNGTLENGEPKQRSNAFAVDIDGNVYCKSINRIPTSGENSSEKDLSLYYTKEEADKVFSNIYYNTNYPTVTETRLGDILFLQEEQLGTSEEAIENIYKNAYICTPNGWEELFYNDTNINNNINSINDSLNSLDDRISKIEAGSESNEVYLTNIDFTETGFTLTNNLSQVQSCTIEERTEEEKNIITITNVTTGRTLTITSPLN